MKEPVQQSFRPLTFLATSHTRAPSRTLNPTRLLHSHTINMGKQPVMARQGTRFEPYKNANRRRASPPPDIWGIHAGSHDAQLSSGVFDLLEDLKTSYGGGDLREIFRDHANQPGALGQAIETWMEYDEVIIFLTLSFLRAAQTAVPLANSLLQIRGARQQDHSDFVGTQHVNQIYWNNALELVPGDESGTPDSPVSFFQGVKSLIVELNSHYRFSPLNRTMSIQTAGRPMSVWVVFASL